MHRSTIERLFGCHTASIAFVNISFVLISIVSSIESFQTTTFSVKSTIIYVYLVLRFCFDAMNTLVVATEVPLIVEHCR